MAKIVLGGLSLRFRRVPVGAFVPVLLIMIVTGHQANIHTH